MTAATSPPEPLPPVTARDCAAAAANTLRTAEVMAPAADPETLRWLIDAARAWTELAAAVAKLPALGPPPTDDQ